MEKIYGFAQKDVDRISQSVRRTENSGSSLVSGKNRRNWATAAGVGDTYEGYFKVADSSDEDENEVTVSAGKIILGLTTESVGEDFINISSSGYVFYDISYDAGYDIELSTLSSFPEQTIDFYAIVLAYVEYTAPVAPATVGSISITQLNYGIPYGAGRVF